MKEFLLDPVVTGFCLGVLFTVIVLFGAVLVQATLTVLRDRREHPDMEKRQRMEDALKHTDDGRWV